MLGYILVIVVSVLFGIALDRHICNSALGNLRYECDKYKGFFGILEQWLSNKQNKIKMETYLESQGYYKVAIYGMSVLGNLLYQELKNTDIEVSYAIDRSSDNMYFDLPVIKPSDEYDEVDAIIVTAILDYEKIKANIRKRSDIKVISIEDIVYEAAEM